MKILAFMRGEKIYTRVYVVEGKYVDFNYSETIELEKILSNKEKLKKVTDELKAIIKSGAYE